MSLGQVLMVCIRVVQFSFSLHISEKYCETQHTVSLVSAWEGWHEKHLVGLGTKFVLLGFFSAGVSLLSVAMLLI